MMVTNEFKSRVPRSDKGATRMLSCDRCGRTLGQARIVVTNTFLSTKEWRRYCSEKCFDKANRKGLSRLLPI